MATINWKRSVNQSVGSVTSAIFTTCITCKQKSDEAPIDIFYKETREILSKFVPDDFTNCEWLGAYLSLGIFSSTENYFRELFSEVMHLCPCSQKASANCQISLGSVIWHPDSDFPRGAFEHLSFADSAVIIKSAKNYIDVDLKITKLNRLFSDFDNICELRHGIVHSSRIIAGKNAIKLGINSSLDKSYINIGYAELQDILLICNRLVTTVNTHLFEILCHRWAIHWRMLPSWNHRFEHAKFKKIWKLFYSIIDSSQSTIPVSISMMKCKNLVKAEYGV